MTPLHPRNSLPVEGPCVACGRSPRPGEIYGTRPEDWDFTNMCPDCWDKMADDGDEAHEGHPHHDKGDN